VLYNQEMKKNRNMNNKQVIRLNESQLNNIVRECVTHIMKENIEDNMMISLNDAIAWIKDNADYYTFLDERYVAPSDRARFYTDDFVQDFRKAMLKLTHI
jgi:hypothetical protein